MRHTVLLKDVLPAAAELVAAHDACLVSQSKLEAAIQFIKGKLSPEDYEELKKSYQFSRYPIKLK